MRSNIAITKKPFGNFLILEISGQVRLQAFLLALTPYPEYHKLIDASLKLNISLIYLGNLAGARKRVTSVAQLNNIKDKLWIFLSCVSSVQYLIHYSHIWKKSGGLSGT